MSGDRKGVTVGGLYGLRAFPAATAFERHPDGSLSVFDGDEVIAVFEPGFGGVFMSDVHPRWSPWTRWVEPRARRAHDLAVVIRRHLREGQADGT